MPTENSIDREPELSRTAEEGLGQPTTRRYDERTLAYCAARDVWKISEPLVLREDNVLYYVGIRPLRSNQHSSKSRPKIRGRSPANLQAERPFLVVSMDFAIPLPKSRRGYVMDKAMADAPALRVAQALRSVCTGDSAHPLSSDMTETHDS
ncbi:hypothetical protein PHMEG_0005594 [Phytophthora megakarya]|uniref:Reverse transcriptase n=1 Tax=Phytophthora megakarya TaxID=4795 RepID=A0A225WSF9_9STRA|nr:hypothetical protein PHMEG_0005594 [Phytophthora megakarya]